MENSSWFNMPWVAFRIQDEIETTYEKFCSLLELLLNVEYERISSAVMENRPDFFSIWTVLTIN